MLRPSFAVLAAAVVVHPSAHAKLHVVTTTTDLADIARAVGGDRVQATAMARGPQDPHFVEAKPSLMLELHRADLLITVGLDLEIGWLPAVALGARNPEVNPGAKGFLDASAAVKPIQVTPGADRSQGDVHPLGNPHYWLDPENARAVAHLVAERLAALDPTSAAAYRAGAAAFSARIDEKLKEWSGRLAPFRGLAVVTYHKTLDYFLLRFDLRSFGSIEPRPGIPPAPAHLADLVRRMRAEGVKLVLTESFYDERVPHVVAEQAGAAMEVVPVSVGATPAAKDYFALIDALVSAVERGLGKGRSSAAGGRGDAALSDGGAR